LGINPRWHEIGRATDWEREQYRRAAKANLVQTLYNLRASRPPEWSDAHEKLAQMPEDTTHFYFAGRFQPGKGVVNTLKGYIEFVAGMKQSSPESLRDKKYSMIFGGPIGEPVYSEFMQVLADTEPELRKSVMESLIVVGGIDFFDLTVMGHVFMGTSDNESFYLTLAEAMAVGNAVSGFDDRVYDYEENQLDMDSRPILLNPNNPSEIAQAMETYRDERQRLMNGDRNRLVAMNYSSLSSAEIFTAQTTRKLKNGHHWSLTM
jgi:glycosyltransferase involved in cell wall biosynthesis